MTILAIDPGSTESAFVVVYGYLPIKHSKVPNEELLTYFTTNLKDIDTVVIEMVASYGMPVGKEVFETVRWIGRFAQKAIDLGLKVEYLYRNDVKMNLCYRTSKVNDAVIRQALIDRFGDVGVKKNPGFFYGFKKDIWAAFAVAVTYLDKVGGKR